MSVECFFDFIKRYIFGPIRSQWSYLLIYRSIRKSIPRRNLLSNWNGSFILRPSLLLKCTLWQYNFGEYALPPQAILGSIIFSCKSKFGKTALLYHLGLNGSSKKVIGQNLTSSGTVCQIDTSLLEVCSKSSSLVKYNLIKKNAIFTCHLLVLRTACLRKLQ